MAETPLPFIQLMELSRLHERDGDEEKGGRFMSTTPCFNAGGGAAYGGHVYAQAVWAAAQTVGVGMIVHVRLPHPPSAPSISLFPRLSNNYKLT